MQVRLGALNAASMDVNTACTSFLYGLSTATAMIRTGVVRNAVVIGVELISQFMDWTNRGVAVLFGDGAAAVVLQATERQEGLIGEKLGCSADARSILRVRGMGCDLRATTACSWATRCGTSTARRSSSARSGDGAGIAGRAGEVRRHASTRSTSSSRTRPTCASSSRWRSASGCRWRRCYVTVQRYGNMSSATVPVALVDALEEGRVKPGALILMPAFGGGLTWCSHLVRWGERVTPLGTTDIELPPCNAVRARDGQFDPRAASTRTTAPKPG